MPKISLTEKLVLYFLLIGILTIISVSWYAYQSGKNAIIARTFDQLTSVRVVKKNEVEKFINQQFRELELYSRSNNVLRLAGLLNSSPTNDSTSLFPFKKELEKDNFLSTSYPSNANILSLYLFKPGLPVLELMKGAVEEKIIPAFLDQKTWEESTRWSLSKIDTNNFIISDLIQDDSGNSRLFAGKKVSVPGDGTVFLVVELSMLAVNSIMVENDPATGWGVSGESYIVGADYLMRTPSRFIGSSVLKTHVKTTASINAFNSSPGSCITKDYRGIKVLSSYSKLNIKGLDWAILAEIDLSEAMAPVNALRNEILFLSIFITFLVFVLALILARSISKPMQKLKKAAERIREGDYEIDLPVSSQDEIGSLTKAFNEMAGQIRQQAKARIDGQEIERQRLSRELHDGLGQTLVAARYKLESSDCSNPETSRNIEATKNLVDQIIDEIRRISNNLMPGVLQEFGLESSMQFLARELSANSPVKVHLLIENIPSGMMKIQQIYLFRIVQEGLNNIIKHADCDQAWVEVSKQGQDLRLSILDKGRGFIPESPEIRMGKGLHNMRERIHVLQGQMELNSSPEKGTLLIFTLPLKLQLKDDKDHIS